MKPLYTPDIFAPKIQYPKAITPYSYDGSSRIPQTGQLWTHYKGSNYVVLTKSTGFDEENYISYLLQNPEVSNPTIWTRPTREFLDKFTLSDGNGISMREYTCLVQRYLTIRKDNIFEFKDSEPKHPAYLLFESLREFDGQRLVIFDSYGNDPNNTIRLNMEYEQFHHICTKQSN